MSEAMSSQGTYISTSNGDSPETFTELAEVTNIGGPNETSEEIDVTHLRSPGAYREFIQSFKDGGELPLTLNFIPGSISQGSIAGIRADYQANPQTVKRRQITYPDGSTCVFSSFVKGIGTAAAVGEKLSLDVTLRISGATTWTEVLESPQQS